MYKCCLISESGVQTFCCQQGTSFFGDVPMVEFMYPVFTHLPGDSVGDPVLVRVAVGASGLGLYVTLSWCELL